MESLVLIIGFGAILQGLFLAGLYFFSKKHNSSSNKVLGLFLLALIWEGVNTFLPVDEIGSYSIGYYFGLPESKIFMPILFFHYVLFKIARVKNYKVLLNTGYLLAALVVCLTLYNVVNYSFTGNDLRQLLGDKTLHQIFMTQQVVAYLLSVLAMILSILEVLKAKRIAENIYSDPDKLKLKWLWQFVFLFIPMVLLWGLELIRIFFNLPNEIELVVIINWVLIFILLYYFSYKAFTQESLFHDVQYLSFEKDPKLEGVDKDLMVTIEQSMFTEKHFTDPDLKLHDFSRAIQVSPRKISGAIKQYQNSNFSTWVNAFRVEEAILLIQSKTPLSIEGIGQEVGFKSRSALYNAFKKIKGKTPGDFK